MAESSPVNAPPPLATPTWMVVAEKSTEKPQLWERFSDQDMARLEAMHNRIAGWREKHGLQDMTLAPAKPLHTTQHADLTGAYVQRDGLIVARGTVPDHPSPPFTVKVMIGDDALYECDVHQMLMYPIYWSGFVREVRRAMWFALGVNNKWAPCEMALGKQVEEGYRKYTPWLYDVVVVEPVTVQVGAGSAPAAANQPSGQAPSAAPAQTVRRKALMPEHRHALLGDAYLEQYVVYTSATSAWILADTVTAKMAQAVLGKLTSGENLGGIRLVRGFDNIPAAPSSKDKPVTTRLSNTSLDQAQEVLPATHSRRPSMRPDTHDEEVKLSEHQHPTAADAKSGVAPADKEIDHLLLVVHGIGAKLGESIESVSFVNDVTTLRQSMKQSMETPSTASGTASPTAPTPPRIQVLPIQWRQEIKFATAPSDFMPMPHGQPNAPPAADHGTLLTEPSVMKGQFGRTTPVAAQPSYGLSSSAGRDDVLHFHYGQSQQDVFSPPPPGTTPTGSAPTTPNSAHISGDRPETSDDQKLPALDEIMLTGVPAVRMLVSDVVLDVLLYMTPRYRGEIIASVTRELNRVYRLFLSRHPSFKGKVSVLGHSLGSVIMMEIMCNQRDVKQERRRPANMSEPVPSVDPILEAHQHRYEDVVHTKEGHAIEQLHFDVDNFFCVGSPAGIFLLLQGERIRGRIPHQLPSRSPGKIAPEARYWQDTPLHHAWSATHSLVKRPKVAHLFNIYHSCDPVAARMEPLVSRQLVPQVAYRIPYRKGGLKGLQQGVENISTMVASRAIDALKTSSGYLSSIFAAKTVSAEAGETDVSLRSISPYRKDIDATDDGVKRLNPRYQRIDFALQEGVLENPYLAALSIHMSYWADFDVAMRYWARQADDESDDGDEEEEEYHDLYMLDRRRRCCDGLRQLRLRHPALALLMVILLSGGMAVWRMYAPRRHLLMDVQHPIDIRTMQELRFTVQGVTEGTMRYVVDASLPPYVVNHRIRLYADKLEMSETISASAWHMKQTELQPPVKSGLGVAVWCLQPRSFTGRREQIRLEGTVTVPPSFAHLHLGKRDSSPGFLLNITTDNIDHHWNVLDTDHIERVVMHTLNGHITGRMSTQLLDVQSTNGNIDLSLSLAAPRFMPASSTPAVRVSTTNGDILLNADILGASSERPQRRLAKRTASALHILAHSDSGNVRARYTIPPVSADVEHYKDGYHVDFSLQSRTASSAVHVESDDKHKPRLSPGTVVQYSDTTRSWMLMGNVSTSSGSAQVFGSRANFTLTTLRGEATLSLS
ncbi:hypothetical protein RI367_007547 [Sorochytrium milnesiophthora]